MEQTPGLAGIMTEGSLAVAEDAFVCVWHFLADKKRGQALSRSDHKENGTYLHKSLFYSFSYIVVVH
jgi:hypothetical protein